MKVIGIFSGIGGFEQGLQRAGLSTELLCEADPCARRVLIGRFKDIPLENDVRRLKSLPRGDVLVAGFPCQDLSQAGRTRGITGRNSSVVGELFRLVTACDKPPEWLVLENVPFMLYLARGRAMHVITSALEECGYQWAYRVVDTMAFGLPQRRKRIIIVAARKQDPRNVLFCDDAGEIARRTRADAPRGFYWTEGRTGLGWAINGIPPLKGGSGVGIPSSPAIWFPDQRVIGTLDIRDAERLQGFRANWTRPAADDARTERIRWRLVGNAVSVPVAEWVGRRLLEPGEYDDGRDVDLDGARRWPTAAWGSGGRIRTVDVSSWPVRLPYRGLGRFLRYPVLPLSERAAAGFHARATESNLRFEDGFLDDVAYHLRRLQVSKRTLPLSGLAAAA